MTAREYANSRIVEMPDDFDFDHGYDSEARRLSPLGEEEYNNLLAEQLLTHSSCDYEFSSDYFLNQVTIDLMQFVPEGVREITSSVYILKTLKKTPNAFAYPAQTSEYTGFLINYWIGASRLMNLVAATFTAYVAHKQNMWGFHISRKMTKHDLPDHAVQELFASLLIYTVEHARSFRTLGEWNRNAPIVDLPKFPKSFDVTTRWLFYYMAMFIIAHEIGHHALGHTKDESALALLGVGGYEEIESTAHRMEYQADEFALNCLISSQAHHNDGFGSVDRVTSAYLCITGLSLIGSESECSVTHPSAELRILNIFRHASDKSETHFDSFCSYNVNFIRTLYMNLSSDGTVENWKKLGKLVFERLNGKPLDMPQKPAETDSGDESR